MAKKRIREGLLHLVAAIAAASWGAGISSYILAALFLVPPPASSSSSSTAEIIAAANAKLIQGQSISNIFMWILVQCSLLSCIAVNYKALLYTSEIRLVFAMAATTAIASNTYVLWHPSPPVIAAVASTNFLMTMFATTVCIRWRTGVLCRQQPLKYPSQGGGVSFYFIAAVILVYGSHGYLTGTLALAAYALAVLLGFTGVAVEWYRQWKGLPVSADCAVELAIQLFIVYQFPRVIGQTLNLALTTSFGMMRPNFIILFVRFVYSSVVVVLDMRMKRTFGYQHLLGTLPLRMGELFISTSATLRRTEDIRNAVGYLLLNLVISCTKDAGLIDDVSFYIQHQYWFFSRDLATAPAATTSTAAAGATAGDMGSSTPLDSEPSTPNSASTLMRRLSSLARQSPEPSRPVALRAELKIQLQRSETILAARISSLLVPATCFALAYFAGLSVPGVFEIRDRPAVIAVLLVGTLVEVVLARVLAVAMFRRKIQCLADLEQSLLPSTPVTTTPAMVRVSSSTSAAQAARTSRADQKLRIAIAASALPPIALWQTGLPRGSRMVSMVLMCVALITSSVYGPWATF